MDPLNHEVERRLFLTERARNQIKEQTHPDTVVACMAPPPGFMMPVDSPSNRPSDDEDRRLLSHHATPGSPRLGKEYLVVGYEILHVLPGEHAYGPRRAAWEH